MESLKQFIEIAPEVQKALDENKPIIALESTIISHGMPYPQNVETARNCERIARENGAVPATMAIIGGKLKIGLTDDELEYFGKEGHNVHKASRRDIAIIVAQKLDGATTVATTMMLAKMAGIKVFATGGIGGVHRGAETTMDISADLEELAETEVMVVCAGAKSILDIGLTLEYLETKGVPVIGYGTDHFPEFYTRGGRFSVDARLDTPEEVADVFATKMDMGVKGGMVVGNPIPEKWAMDDDYINGAIEKTLKAAEEQGIKGKDTTPFILGELHHITGNDSLASNIELVYNNVKVAAQIAASLQNK